MSKRGSRAALQRRAIRGGPQGELHEHGRGQIPCGGMKGADRGISGSRVLPPAVEGHGRCDDVKHDLPQDGAGALSPADLKDPPQKSN